MRPPFCISCVLAGFVAISAYASSTTEDVRSIKPPSSNGQFVFSLLPRSFNKNALVDMTVFGEVTEAGRQKPIPSTAAPLYYIAQSGGYKADERAPMGERIPSSEKVAQQMKSTLAAAGYRPVEGEQKPNVVVIYTWGSQYGGMSLGIRAALMGGEVYAKEVMTVFKSDRDYAQSGGISTFVTGTVDGRNSGPPAIGSSFLRDRNPLSANNQNRQPSAASSVSTFNFGIFRPIERYMRENDNNQILLQQMRGEFYYIVISAYDYEPMLKREKVLLWRTRLTVDAAGVSFDGTLSALLTASRPYVGKDTGRPGTITKKMIRQGTVEIGPSEIVEENVDIQDGPTKTRGKR